MAPALTIAPMTTPFMTMAEAAELARVTTGYLLYSPCRSTPMLCAVLLVKHCQWGRT